LLVAVVSWCGVVAQSEISMSSSRRRVAALLLGAFALVALLARAQGADCSQPFQSSSGDTYDIKPLIGQIITGTGYGNTYKVSVCTTTLPWCGLCPDAGFCEMLNGYDNCVGMFQAVTGLANGAGVELSYPNGEFGRTGTLKIMCDAGASGFTDILVQNDGDLMIAKHALACPGAGGLAAGQLSPGGVILIILLCLVVVYFVGGAAYLHFVQGNEVGLDLVIHREFWAVIPALVIEGVMFTIGSIKSLIGRCTGGS